MNDQESDRWLDALSGKPTADDAESRQAAALRAYFVQQQQHEKPLDTAAQIRAMNMLAARGAFAPPGAKAAPLAAKPSLAERLREWFFPGGHAHSGHFAGVTMALFAIAIVPTLLQNNHDEDGPDSIKSVPTAPAAQSMDIDSANPEQSANQLAAALARHGVVATIQAQGPDRVVQAQIPPERLAATQTTLVAMGLAAAPNGNLLVRYHQLPQ